MDLTPGSGRPNPVAVLNKLSRYRDISTLGSGGMATVVLAQDTLLGREVALKRMHTAADPSGTARLRREALVGASISHANLVGIYDVVTTDEGDVVIVMEYVEGENLRDALRREGQLPVTETLRILEGVAAGLDAIHQQGIVHRDVKPANILLGANGSVKLADLGIAAVSDRTRITSAGTVLGSFSYMAPEQLEDAPATRAIDVYALSAVAYEALSGVQAHRESNPLAVAHAIATQPPPDLRQVWSAAPPAAAELLLAGMARDPAQRPRSAGELVARLRAALEPQETQRAPAVAPRARKPSPAPIAAAGGALAGAAAGAGAAEAAQPARGNPSRPDASRPDASGPTRAARRVPARGGPAPADWPATSAGATRGAAHGARAGPARAARCDRRGRGDPARPGLEVAKPGYDGVAHHEHPPHGDHGSPRDDIDVLAHQLRGHHPAPDDNAGDVHGQGPEHKHHQPGDARAQRRLGQPPRGRLLVLRARCRSQLRPGVETG